MKLKNNLKKLGLHIVYNYFLKYLNNLFGFTFAYLIILKKKIFKYIFSFFFTPVFFFLIIIIYLIRPLILIRFNTLNTSRIGHFCINLDLYLTNKNKNEKNFDFFSHHDYICNKYLFSLAKKKIFFIPKFIIDNLLRTNNFFLYFFEFPIQHIAHFSKTKDRDTENFWQNTPPVFILNNKSEIFFEKNNILPNDKIVCFCIRDNLYLKNRHPQKDFSYHNDRNQKIENFYLAAEQLAKNGYKVIRMGRDQEKKFEATGNGIIDYAFSDFKSDRLDLIIFSKAYFILSANAGMEELGNLFRKPIIMSTIPINIQHTSSDKFICLSKHHVCKKTGKNLTMSDIINRYTESFYTLDDLLNKKNFKNEIEFKDNTPEEWLDVAFEMIDRLNKKEIVDDKLVQIKYWNLYKKLIEKSKFKNYHGEFKAKFSATFAKRNPEWLL